jgi:hypothetical protein
VATSRTHLEAGFERWRSIGAQRIDTDLQQIATGRVGQPGLPAKAPPWPRRA